MTTKSHRMIDNLKAATEDLLSEEHLTAISGDGTEGNQGIEANNRLIWGQVFLWPEADGDWRTLWNDSQVFESIENYQAYKEAFTAYKNVKDQTIYLGGNHE